MTTTNEDDARLFEIVIEGLAAAQGLLKSGDVITIDSRNIRLEQMGLPVETTLGGTVRLAQVVAIGSQAVVSVLMEERHAKKD